MPWLGDVIARGVGVIEPAQRVGEDPGRIDDHLREDPAQPAALRIARHHAAGVAVAAARLEDLDHLHVVDQRRAVIGRGAREVDRHARVVELRVVIHRAADEVLLLDVRDRGDRGVAVEAAARREVQVARERVVELEADAVERALPPAVARHHEAEVRHEMRRVAVEQPALAQRLGDEREVELLQIAHAAVHELGAAARGALGEVVRLEQQGPIAAARGVDGNAEPRGAAADHDDVEGLPVEPVDHLVALHRGRMLPSVYPAAMRCAASRSIG